MAYIDKEKTLAALNGKDYFSEQVKMLISYIVNSQPEADVAPVVRCRDCKHFCECELLQGSKMDYISYCQRRDFFTKTTDFCSFGERRAASKVKPRRIPWEAD